MQKPDMKKATYQTPRLIVVEMETEQLIAQSTEPTLTVDPDTGGEEYWVKSDGWGRPNSLWDDEE